MPFAQTRRSPKGGFTLLEALLACAAGGVVLATTYSLVSQLLRTQRDLVEEFSQAALARAILEEYIVTYPAMASSGVYADTWRWRLSESSQEPSLQTAFDSHYVFRKVTVYVERLEGNFHKTELSTVATRSILRE